MNFKYIGEAVALLAIAYSIFRWIARNVDETDGRSHSLLDVGPTRLGDAREASHGGARSDGKAMEPTPNPALPPDPAMLDEAAAMFRISREEIVRMEPQERALLLSGYRAARGAQRRSGPLGDNQTS